MIEENKSGIIVEDFIRIGLYIKQPVRSHRRLQCVFAKTPYPEPINTTIAPIANHLDDTIMTLL